jgi:hypothetical protein
LCLPVLADIPVRAPAASDGGVDRRRIRAIYASPASTKWRCGGRGVSRGTVGACQFSAPLRFEIEVVERERSGRERDGEYEDE